MFVNKESVTPGRETAKGGGWQPGPKARGCLQRKPWKKDSGMGLQGVRTKNFFFTVLKRTFNEKKDLDWNMQQ